MEHSVNSLLIDTVFDFVQVVSLSERGPLLVGILVLFTRDIFQVMDLCVPNEFSCLPVTPDVTSSMYGTVWKHGLEGTCHRSFHKPKKKKIGLELPCPIKAYRLMCCSTVLCPSFFVVLGVRGDFSSGKRPKRAALEKREMWAAGWVRVQVAQVGNEV